MNEACATERSAWHSWINGASAREYIVDPKVFFETWYIKARELANCLTAFFQEDLDTWGHHMEALLPDKTDRHKNVYGNQPVLKPSFEDYGARFIPLEVNEEARAPGTVYLARRKVDHSQYKGVCCLKPIAWTLIEEDGHHGQYVCRENSMVLNFAEDSWVTVPEEFDAPFVKTRLDDEEGDVDPPDRTAFPDHGDAVDFTEDLNEDEVRSDRNVLPPNKVSFVTEEKFLEKVNEEDARAVPCKAKGRDLYLYGVIAVTPSSRKEGAEPVPLPRASLLHNEVGPVLFGRVTGQMAYYLGIRFRCENEPAEEEHLDVTNCKQPDLWALRETTMYDKTELRPLMVQDWKSLSGGDLQFTKPYDTDIELIMLFSILAVLTVLSYFAYRLCRKED